MTIQNQSDHDAIAIIMAAGGPGASAESRLASAATILGFERKRDTWTRRCPSCCGKMWLAKTTSDDIVCIGFGFGRPACSDVALVRGWLRDLGFQPARERAAVVEMLRQHEGEGISTDPDDRYDDDEDIDLRIVAALSVIPAHHYELWYRIGAAIYAALNDDGFALWDAWSRTAPEKYDENEATNKWRECRKMSRIKIGTLFHHASEHDPEWWRIFFRMRNNRRAGT